MTYPVPIRAIATTSSTVGCDVQELAATVGLPLDERTKLRDGGLVSIPAAQGDLVALVDDVIGSLEVAGCTDVVFAHSLELDDADAERLTKALTMALPDLVRSPLLLTGRPCSVIHLGVDVAIRLLQQGEGDVLLLGGDVAATHDDRFFFGSAMGDSAVGLVLGGVATFAEILSTHSTWHVLAAEGVASDPADIARFRAQNPTAIRTTISGALSAADLTWADLTAIVPHTPYRQIWDTIGELCRFPRDRILDDGVADTGHLNSNDVFVHLATAVRTGTLRTGDIAALVSPGFGGSRGCTVVRVS